MENEQSIENQNQFSGFSHKTGKIVKNTVLIIGLLGVFSGYYSENKKVEKLYQSSTCEHKNNKITKKEVIDDFKKKIGNNIYY